MAVLAEIIFGKYSSMGTDEVHERILNRQPTDKTDRDAIVSTKTTPNFN